MGCHDPLPALFEIEHRWYTLTATYEYGIDSNITSSAIATTTISEQESEERGRPAFYQVTWNNEGDLTKQINELRIGLGCSQTSVGNAKKHVTRTKRAIKCSDFIQQDLQYRRVMNYDDDTLQLLVSRRFPQHVDSEECMETRQELKEAIEKHADSEGMQ